ncbi:unnamed protein product [Paramecium primaurelia]|uniref:Uncharacterized protein n=1 Tax=Paramecium primaurelia TaxID=5886 RepID=A0A8S1LIT2_PARPR|nr:unnamed protein product [Paramecium primaurelia]
MGEIVTNQLFVAGYSRSKVTDERDVREIFRKYESVKEVAYKGSYSFITFGNEDEAKEALTEMNGATHNGQKLKVDVVDNRKGRKTGPNESDQCFKCGKGGHWARNCPKGGRSPQRSRRYSNSKSRHHRRRSDSRSRSSQSSSRSRRRNRDHRNRRRYSNSPKRGDEQKKGNHNKRRSPSDSQFHSKS